MITGDPFETEELDELRVTQRRVLRWIPREIMEMIDKKEPDERVPEIPEDLKGAHAELVFRRFIQNELAIDEDDELIARMRRSTEGELLDRATALLTSTWSGDLRDAAREYFTDTGIQVKLLDSEELGAIRRLRMALLFADALGES